MVLKCERRGIHGLLAKATARQRLEGVGNRGNKLMVGRISRSEIQATCSVSVCMCAHTCTYVHIHT